MKSYISKWTIARGLQLVIGIAFLVDYFSGKSTFSMIFGGMMFFQAVLNVGCFSSKGCSTPAYDNSTNTVNSDSDEVEYEVI